MDATEVLETIRPAAEAEGVPGLVVGLLRGGRTTFAAAGSLESPGVVRASSNTKPLVAALTLALVEDGVLALTDEVRRYVPELAGRRVLTRPDAPVDGETVPARREVTVEDLLTMRLGLGFEATGPCPVVEAATEAGLGFGPPAPERPLTPDEWVARLAALPLPHQPGEVWRYEISFAVLGVLLARATGTPLPELLHDRVLEPIGMRDTAFRAPIDALPPQWQRTGDGELEELDGAGAASRWTSDPAFPDACGGLVTTAADLLRFAGELLGGSLLSAASVTAMTTDQLSTEEREEPGAAAFLGGGGWGYGVGVHPDRYGWAGGLGTLWWTWPGQRTAAVLLTQVTPPTGPVFDAFTATVGGEVGSDDT